MAANQASAVASLRTINTAEITYNSTYPAVGFAPARSNLGGTLGPACPGDTGKSDYKALNRHRYGRRRRQHWISSAGSALVANRSGIHAFCAEEDGVVAVDPAGACSSTEAGVVTFNPLNQ